MEYKSEDYSQSAINAGQRKINYALTVVDEKLIEAIEALRDAIKALPATHSINLVEVNQAISEVIGFSQQVAGIKPPGCDPDWPA
jgi:aspartate ammonia-lyase